MGKPFKHSLLHRNASWCDARGFQGALNQPRLREMIGKIQADSCIVLRDGYQSQKELPKVKIHHLNEKVCATNFCRIQFANTWSLGSTT